MGLWDFASKCISKHRYKILPLISWHSPFPNWPLITSYWIQLSHQMYSLLFHVSYLGGGADPGVKQEVPGRLHSLPGLVPTIYGQGKWTVPLSQDSAVATKTQATRVCIIIKIIQYLFINTWCCLIKMILKALEQYGVQLDLWIYILYHQWKMAWTTIMVICVANNKCEEQGWHDTTWER